MLGLEIVTKPCISISTAPSAEIVWLKSDTVDHSSSGRSCYDKVVWVKQCRGHLLGVRCMVRVRPVGSPNPSTQEAFPGFQGFNFDSPRTTVPLQQSEQADFVTTRPPRPPNAKPPPNADPRQPGRFTSPRAPPSGSRFSVGNLMTRCLTILLSSTSHSFLGSRKFPSQVLQ